MEAEIEEEGREGTAASLSHAIAIRAAATNLEHLFAHESPTERAAIDDHPAARSLEDWFALMTQCQNLERKVQQMEKNTKKDRATVRS